MPGTKRSVDIDYPRSEALRLPVKVDKSPPTHNADVRTLIRNFYY